MVIYSTVDEWKEFKPGDKHPTGDTKVLVKLSANLQNEGEAWNFNWNITREADYGCRIVAYRVLPNGYERR